jgi:hypothetical protein
MPRSSAAPPMPHSASEHLAKARKNKAYASSIQQTDGTCTEWALIALFYSALHFVQSFLVSRSIEASNHETRNRKVQYDIELRDIYDDYRELYVFSCNARYHMNVYGSKHYAEAYEALCSVERLIDSLLAPQTKPLPSPEQSPYKTSFSEASRPMPGKPKS